MERSCGSVGTHQLVRACHGCVRSLRLGFERLAKPLDFLLHLLHKSVAMGCEKLEAHRDSVHSSSRGARWAQLPRCTAAAHLQQLVRERGVRLPVAGNRRFLGVDILV